MTREELLKMVGSEPDTMKRVDKILNDFGQGSAPAKKQAAEPETKVAQEPKPEVESTLDERAQTALKAVVRILTPFKESVSPELLNQVLEAAGFGTPGQGEENMEKKEASARQSPEPVSDEHKIEAMKVAKKSYDEHLKKLGYQKYDSKQIAQKEMDDECDEVEKKKEEKDEMEKGGKMDKDVEKSAVMKSLLEKVPAEARGAVEAVYKGQLEAIQKAAVLEKEVAEMKQANLKKEMVAKASGFKHLGLDTEKLAETFLELAQKAPAQLEVVEKMLSTADTQVSKGNLFAELGSGLSSPGRATWESIEKAAEGYVAKSGGEKVSPAQATTKFLETAEGKRMYSDYMAEHASARRS